MLVLLTLTKSFCLGIICENSSFKWKLITRLTVFGETGLPSFIPGNDRISCSSLTFHAALTSKLSLMMARVCN